MLHVYRYTTFAGLGVYIFKDNHNFVILFTTILFIYLFQGVNVAIESAILNSHIKAAATVTGQYLTRENVDSMYGGGKAGFINSCEFFL